MAGGFELKDPRAEVAIGWMVEIASGEMSADQFKRFEAWLKLDPRNESAWVRLQEGLMPLGVAARHRLPAGALTDRLQKIHASRRAVATGILSALGLIPAGLAVTDRFVPLGDLLAEEVTRTGEQRDLVLADGSRLVLAPRSAVDVSIGPDLRKIRLIDGGMMVTVARREVPFHIDVDGLGLNADAGVFIAKKRSDLVSFTGIEGTGSVDRGSKQVIGRGDRVTFVDGREERSQVDVDVATAWLDGLLIAKDNSLGAIVDEIRPYFPGVIRVDPQVAHLRATAVVKLNQPNEAIEALAESLQLSIRRVTRYWVAITEPSI